MSETPTHPAEAEEAEARRRPKGRNLRPLVALAPFFLRYRGLMAGGAVSLLAATAATLAVPLAVRNMVDLGFSGGRLEGVGAYFVLMAVIGVTLGLASAGRFFFVTMLGERIVADLRTEVYAHVISLSPSFFESARTGEILSRLTTDTTLIKTIAASSASVALRNLLLFGGAAIMLMVTSARLSGLILLALLLLVAPLIVFGRLVRRLSRVSQDRIAHTSAYAAESLAAMQTVQAFTREELDRTMFSAAVEAAFGAARRRTWARTILTALTITLAFCTIVGVLWIGALAVTQGRMTNGELGQFVLYALFAALSVGALSEVWGDMQLAAGATERLVELLEVEPQIHAPAAPVPLPAPPRGRVRLHDVHFSYPTDPHRRALNGMSLEVHPGQTVALVGPSGAGKTTVFQLLQRFYDPQSGSITLDGVELRDADPQEVRRRMSAVPQEPVVFAMSAAGNIAYGQPGADLEEVRQAAREALADEFICALPRGYDTVFGERGVTLSGGQRQRIAIARALLRDAPVLLLDEATSALDAESEALVQQALRRLMRGRTTLVIAHRLATVQRADRIIVMDAGRVVAAGTHAELVRQGGLYARLANLQFGALREDAEVLAAGGGA